MSSLHYRCAIRPKFAERIYGNAPFKSDGFVINGWLRQQPCLSPIYRLPLGFSGSTAPLSTKSLRGLRLPDAARFELPGFIVKGI